MTCEPRDAHNLSVLESERPSDSPHRHHQQPWHSSAAHRSSVLSDLSAIVMSAGEKPGLRRKRYTTLCHIQAKTETKRFVCENTAHLGFSRHHRVHESIKQWHDTAAAEWVGLQIFHSRIFRPDAVFDGLELAKI
jgi:hypothetical protein